MLSLLMVLRPSEDVQMVATASREEIMTRTSKPGTDDFAVVAGNGLLDRRALLRAGTVFVGAVGTGVGASLTGAAAEPLKDDPWSLVMGAVTPPRQVPS